MTSSIVRPWSAGESLEYRAECRSSEAYAFSRSTRRRISNAATRAGEIGMECLGELLAQSLATGEMIAVHKVASCRSEEHTSELQSQSNLVCRLLLEKKKTIHHEY